MNTFKGSKDTYMYNSGKRHRTLRFFVKNDSPPLPRKNHTCIEF
jgi:hypothetical protein